MTATEPLRIHTARRVISEEHTVPQILPESMLASRGEPVLATAMLIAMMEDATWEAIAPDIPLDRAMLGCAGTYEHTAPTLPGQQVRIEVTCRQFPETGGRQRWTARAINVDTGQLAGVLHHELATPTRSRFYRRLHT